jgi:hypothetical protein
MAKIRIESVIPPLLRKDREASSVREELTPHTNTSRINRLQRTDTDSIVQHTRSRLSLSEAEALGATITKQFSTNESETLNAQGAGLTEERVNALLNDEE